jgi:hypothetical protein
MNAQPRRSNVAVQIILVLTVILAAIVIIAYLMMTNQKPTSYNVQFEVLSDGGFSNITIRAGSLVISKPDTQSTPWRRTIELASGTEVYLTATNPAQTGKLTCSITLNGRAWKKESKVAPKDGVACAGIVP